MSEIKTEREGRRCKKCGNRLSIYNRNNICFCHSENSNYHPSVPYKKPLFSSSSNLGSQTIVNHYGFLRGE